MADKQKLAVSVITQHPGIFVLSSLKRAAFFWTTPPDEYFLWRGRNLLRESVFLMTAVLGFCGLYLANRNQLRGVLLFAGVLFFYPLIYYILHVDSRYSHPVAPVMLMLSVYALLEIRTKLFTGSRTNRQVGVPQ